jgi:transcriptional regulator with XRE-family HTH domain
MLEHAVSCVFMQEQRDALREYMRKKGFSQARLAVKAGVSQSTVSRALRRSAGRHSQARHRLLVYARVEEFYPDLSTDDGTESVVRAFNKIWDGSKAHAISVAKIISALQGLRPARSATKGGRIEGQRKPTQKTPKKRRIEPRSN